MRSLALYIRQIFCKHDFDIEDGLARTEYKDGYKRYLYCKKCGYHTNHWKFL